MKTQHHSGGFTLVEVLVAASIVVVLMAVLISMTDQTQRLVKATSAKVEQFQEARVAFESMTRRLSQATLNTFWDYQYDSNGNPTGYQRTSELRFHSGSMKDINPTAAGNIQPGHGVFFQAPLGRVDDTVKLGALDHLLNTWGYFLEIGTDADRFPNFLKTIVPARKRYRLMELMESSEKLSVYNFQGNDTKNSEWFTHSLASTNTNRPVRVLAENIVALIIRPRLALADEKRLNEAKGTASTTTVVLPPKVPTSTYEYSSTTNLIKDTATWSSLKTPLEKAMLNPFSQLPPVVQVIMVAIDEPSARHLEDLYGTDDYLGISTNPDPVSKKTLFIDPKKLEDAAGVTGDLSTFTSLLSSPSKPNIRASYRVFSSNVTIKGAKWSLHTAGQ
jgi:uncharacterized protein (TIGR02599 family)